MKYVFSFLILGLMPMVTSAQTIDTFANNKELISRELKDSDRNQAIAWSLNLDSNGAQFKIRARETLKKTINSYARENTFCDLYFPEVFKSQTQIDGIAFNEYDRSQFLNYLRASNLIDDIFYKSIKGDIRKF